jgi:hypothetical protein
MKDFIRNLLGQQAGTYSGSSETTAYRPWARVFLILHPFLCAIAPILHLYSRNLNEASALTALIFSAGALLGTAVVLLLARLWQKSLIKAALIATLFNVLFYAYGLIFDFLMKHEPIKLSYDAWHVILITLCLAVVFMVGVLIRRSQRRFEDLSRFLSGALAIFLIICVINFGRQEWHLMRVRARTPVIAENKAPAPPEYPRAVPLETTTVDTPNVFYIILDGYARADTLQRVCHCDNSEFLNFLRSRGFYVAEESCANYPMTFMSVASSLNMRYLDDEVKSPSYSAVYAMWDHPLAAQVLQSKGYRFVYMATNFRSNLEGVDFVFQRKPSWLLNQFAESQLRNTALRVLESQMADQHLYEFEMLKQVPRIEGPTFTFCHIIAPHPPYVFDRNGKVCADVPQSMFFKDGWEQQQNPASESARQAYVEQLLYVNKRMEEVIDSILAQSKTPPIIMIQGDHGTFFTLPDKITDDSLDQFAQERLPVLNAYLVPEKIRQKLRPDISPVNSFRLVFNECFGEHFEILPEKHLSGWYYGELALRDATAIVHPSAIQQASAQPITTLPAELKSR